MSTLFFSLIFGLITSHDPTSENSGLFFAEYLTLKAACEIRPSEFDKSIYESKMANAYVNKGLYLRSKHHQNRTVSHDEITGMIVGSYVLKTQHRYDIIKYLEQHDGNYSATGKDKRYSLADYYAWLTLTGRWQAAIFAPFYTANLLISIGKDKEKTSSKLLYFTELFHMRKISDYSDFLWRVYKKKMESQYGKEWIKELFAIYFSREPKDHPLIYLSERACYDKL